MTTPLLSLLLLTGFSSCEKTAEVPPALTKAEYRDVAYSSNAAQKLDVFLPAGRTDNNTKIIVFIHGGSWNAGDKAEFNDGIAAVRDQLTDFAIFNINYRLAQAPNNVFPAQINDVQSALDFIKNKAAEYHINPSKIALVGASAGAHLALLQAYKNNSDGRIKAVVDLFGPTDLTDLYTNHPTPLASQPVLVNFLGTTPQLNASLYQQSSPLTFVTAQSVPTLIFHGSADPVVPLAQSTSLKNKLQLMNVKVEMTVYPGAGHGWFDVNLIDTYGKTITFIRQNVQ